MSNLYFLYVLSKELIKSLYNINTETKIFPTLLEGRGLMFLLLIKALHPPRHTGHIPSVKSTKLFSTVGEGTEIPIAFRTPYVLTMSPGVTCCASSFRLLVTCSAREKNRKTVLGVKTRFLYILINKKQKRTMKLTLEQQGLELCRSTDTQIFFF